ncbi:type II toxin-antitoxin system VapC family toxin [Asanoa sp. WMMD1127]|uniref:type II toxin-antitoxin system VapC family toxin n=1 Tax=Asanoa sp. WMMD1127 TaxID=3016107 RepID=UPI002417D28C|nr:type II toxin-antitoxin system VapC family toxin [Asanoa sp. WMMD1127]MDG4821539.1 type II toxin-antitoxin system VapC family toxin [Asanoa sp. WMMD1127]
MIYLDSSAVVKLAHREPETVALRVWLEANARPLASSALARTESHRALQRTNPTAIPALRAVLATIHQRPLTDELLDAAAALPGAGLRSLDALHLATAESLRHVLTWFVSYDKKLLDAAKARGLPVIAPA